MSIPSKFISAFLSAAVRLGADNIQIQHTIDTYNSLVSDEEKISLSAEINIHDMVLTDFSFLNEEKYQALFNEINRLLQNSPIVELQSLESSLDALKGKNAFNLKQESLQDFIVVHNTLQNILETVWNKLAISEKPIMPEAELKKAREAHEANKPTVEKKYREQLATIYKALTLNDMAPDANLKSTINSVNIKYHPDRRTATLTTDQEDAYKRWTDISQQYKKAMGDLDPTTSAKNFITNKLKEENSSKLFWWRFHSIALYAANTSATMLSLYAMSNNAENFHSLLYYPISWSADIGMILPPIFLIYTLYTMHTTLKKNEGYMNVNTTMNSYIDAASLTTSSYPIIPPVIDIAIMGLLYAINGASGVTEDLPMQLLAMTALSIPSLVCISTLLVESKESLPKFLHPAYDLYQYGNLGVNYININTTLNTL